METERLMREFIQYYRSSLINNLMEPSNIIYLFPKVMGSFWICRNKVLVVYGQYISGEIMLNFIGKDRRIKLVLKPKDYYLLRNLLVDNTF